MYAVGRLGSYITRGVYTVSGPFHPFGGAVDIVVVQQQDGSLKSSPWYVRFGKFQGVLKAREKVVDINVNGVEADFHMYLDPRGEAYFLREVDTREVDAVLPLSSSEEGDGKVRESRPLKSKSLDCNFDACDSDNDPTESKILGFVLGSKSAKDSSFSKEEDDSKVGRVMSLDRAEVAADLLEMKWSTDFLSETKFKDYKEGRKDDGAISGGRLEAGLVLREQHFVNNVESHVDNVTNSEISKEVKETNVANVVHEEHGGSFENSVTKEESLGIGSNDSNKPETGSEEPLKFIAESCTEVASIEQERASAETESSTVAVSVSRDEDDQCTKEAHETNEIGPSLVSNGEFQERFVEDQFMFSDLDDAQSSNDHVDQDTHSPSTSEINHEGNASMDRSYASNSSPQRSDHESFQDDTGAKGNIRRYPSNIDIVRSCKVTEEGIGRQAKSLPNMWSQFDEFDSDNFDDSSYYSFDSKSRSSKWDTLRKDVSKIIKADLVKELQSSDSQSAHTVSKDLKDDSVAEGDLSDIVDGTGGSWSLWPFRRSRSKKFSQKDSEADVGSEAEGEKEVCSPKANKRQTRSLTPTSEQLASLNLTEGKNTVTFTFSTSVLGPQQVDARIYLWRWDTRIVISDVDGTITKSDVLGQFMPLVGRDWSHIGVTHLFSAIKENGYQMLFLSARAISQASITRQFLFNLKQDGKALPDGPVVISPDGLFPSLFREVIRRAPHEFKIACLEDIKACFPSDRNPFYAGFGNRDTDEFSYLKVGIPKGKIFIINPKGEVVVNRCVDSKSYTSLHALVNGIFPPISVHEEEDYNSWNFWKLPPPTMD